jgi:hypothetical protein
LFLTAFSEGGSVAALRQRRSTIKRAPLAQLAEQVTLNHKVPGSIPGRRTRGALAGPFSWLPVRPGQPLDFWQGRRRNAVKASWFWRLTGWGGVRYRRIGKLRSCLATGPTKRSLLDSLRSSRRSEPLHSTEKYCATRRMAKRPKTKPGGFSRRQENSRRNGRNSELNSQRHPLLG